jgi:cysteine desulfurase
VGALYVRDGVKLPPFIIGGGQESGRRSGTEAVPNIVGLGRASQLAMEFTGHEQIRNLRDRLERQILESIPDTRVNGTTDPAKRLPNTSNLSFEGLLAPEIVSKLDEAGICVSTGSACHSESSTASPVLTAMQIPESTAMGAIRFSLGRYNTEADIEQTLTALSGITRRPASLSA